LAEIYYAKSRKFTDYSQCVTDRRTGKQTETDRQTDRKASSEADCSQQGHRRCCQSKGIMWVPVSDRPIYNNFTFNRLHDIAKYWSVQNCYFSVFLLNTITPGKRLQTQVVTYYGLPYNNNNNNNNNAICIAQIRRKQQMVSVQREKLSA